MTIERLTAILYNEVEADIETEAAATNEYQEGYSVGFNDCRARALKAVAAELGLSK